MKNKQNKISNPKFGMTKARSSYLLEDSAYTFMLNGQSVDESGNRLTLSNEHSNILASKIKTGFVVIGLKNNVIKNRTYFFLVNPDTNVSEIGYIENDRSFTQTDDIVSTNNCDDCTTSLNLAEPLENTTQTAHQTYTTLLEDSCNNCLNFNVNYPIFDIEIKIENIGEVMFFTDALNEVRYVKLDDLTPYGFEGEEICGTGSETPTCLDCDKLRVFPLYVNPKIKDCSRSFGGSLKKGVYEVYFAYSDELGNERTSYTPVVSPPISIFNEGDVIFDQTENDAETNFSIRVELEDLDTRFTHYKIVVAENTSQTVEQGSIVYRDKGIFSVSDTIVLVSDNSGTNVSASRVLVPLPAIETWKGLAASNSFLFGYGIKEVEEVNLQPVFNLMGSLVEWETTVAKGSIYAKAIGSKFKGYNRDEVYPLGIRPISNDGYQYPIFPLIPRPSNATDIQSLDNTDTQSITNVADNCDSVTRDRRWQYYNTATDEGTCSGFSVPTQTQNEIITTVTTIAVPSAPSSSIDIEGDDVVGYVDLTTFIEDNLDTCGSSPYTGSPLQSICQYFDLSLLGGFNQSPTLDTECGAPSLISEEAVVTGIINESASFIDKPTGDYVFVTPSTACVVFLEESDDNVNESFSSSYFLRVRHTAPLLNRTVRTKLITTYSDSPATAITVQNVTLEDLPTYTPAPYVHPWYGQEQDGTTTETDPDVAFASMTSSKVSFVAGSTLDVDDIGGGIPLGTDITATTTCPAFTGATLSGYFTDNVNNGALWFKIPIKDRDKFFVEFVRLTEPNNRILRYDYDDKSCWDYFRNRYIRYNIYDSATTNTAVAGAVIELNSSHLIELTTTETAGSTDGFMYMSVELPIAQGKGVGDSAYYNDTPTPSFVHCGVTVPLGSCFSVHTRDEEFSKITVTYDAIDIAKNQTYEATCTYDVPVPTDCAPVPYRYGTFSYWESTEDYPDNSELYDSSTLTINRSDIPPSHQTTFETYYVDSVGGGGEYTLNTANTQFLCKPIRHYKFPDNAIAPFIYNNRIGRDADVVVYPLGVKIDDRVFAAFMDIAVTNNLISQDRRDRIIGYEIYRGDRQLSKSIISSGLMYDMRTYSDNSDRSVRYSNFPYNAFGEDKLNTELDNSSIDLGTSNYMFTFHSPESDYYKSDQPTEISIQGYQFGKSVTTIAEVEEHPKWVILGRKARTLATTLAIAEVIAEAAVNIAQSAEVYRVQFGLANSANPIGIGLNIAVAALQTLTAVVSRVGRYRYEWLTTFRNLGTPRNFAYFGTSTGKYNYIRTLQQDGQRLRGVANAVNLKDGFFTLTENVSGEALTINNIDREGSLFLSFTSTYPIDVSGAPYSDYTNHDDNDVPYNSSQVLASEFSCVGGDSPEIYRNIASPYVALKDYNPSQYGTIDSVRWLHTGYTSNLNTPITVTLTGTSGTANVAINGNNYLATFDTDLTTTAANFITTHASGILSTEGVVATSDGAVITLIPNNSAPIVSSANLTGDLVGTVAYTCRAVLGGDIFIAPHSVKRKLPIFRQTAFGLADLTPFAYGLYPNIGKAKYYIDYEVNSEATTSGMIFPNIDYTLETDCSGGTDNFYVEPPAKFYLYYYGQPLFYTETTINTNFRNARVEPWNQFYPQNQDYVSLTQERTVSIRRPNQFFYNYNYSYQGTPFQTKILPAYYSAATYAKQSNNPNTVMYSQQDTSENSITEPWLNYRPNDRYVFPAAYGELKKLKGIESQQVLGTFENQSVVFNAVDSYVDGVTESNRDLGTGGIFARRPKTFNDTDLGYLGTQSSTMLSCEYGHFIVDAYRGQIFRVTPNGQSVEEISKYSNNKPNGMDVWFKEHLPFKILEQYPDFSNYIDNPYNGVGITMGWDSKFKRVLITKKDYVGSTGTTYNGDGTFTNGLSTYTIQEAIQQGVLEDVSWTISYKPEKGGWESYMDFKPNYYVAHTDYFQSGVNQTTDSTETGIWSHLLTNRSMQVFYGKKYPWIVEYPTKNEYVNKKLEALTLWTEAKRYHNEYDFAPDDRVTFNKAVIFSDRENSGNLTLVPNTGSLNQLSQYPITRSSSQQDILITQNNKKWTFNHVFNRVKSNRNNVPLFTYDVNQINKTVNPSAVSFYGKNVLEQMSSETFLVRLTQDATSQYDLELKFASQKEEIN